MRKKKKKGEIMGNWFFYKSAKKKKKSLLPSKTKSELKSEDNKMTSWKWWKEITLMKGTTQGI